MEEFTNLTIKDVKISVSIQYKCTKRNNNKVLTKYLGFLSDFRLQTESVKEFRSTITSSTIPIWMILMPCLPGKSADKFRPITELLSQQLG